jgi:hypothetical protein
MSDSTWNTVHVPQHYAASWHTGWSWLSAIKPLFMHSQCSNVAGTYFSPCETASFHIRCSKWLPIAPVHSWRQCAKLVNTCCNVSTGTASLSCRMFSVRSSMMQGLYM